MRSNPDGCIEELFTIPDEWEPWLRTQEDFEAAMKHFGFCEPGAFEFHGSLEEFRAKQT